MIKTSARPLRLLFVDGNMRDTREGLRQSYGMAYGEAYAAEIAAFIAAMADKAEAQPSGEDGLMALALAEAALKSVAEGRVVRLSEVL